MSSASPELYDISQWPNAVSAALILLNSLIGFLFNAAIIYSFLIDRRQKTAFNLICVFRAVNNIYILVVTMLGVYFPATILGYSIYSPIVESVLITSGVNLMVYNEFQGIYLSVNRLVAIFFPLKYNLICGIKLTFALHMLYYLDRIRNVTFENIDRYNASNFMLFSFEHLAYGGSIVTPDGMFLWAVGLLIFPFLVNAVTFSRFYCLRKRASRSSEHWKKAKQNMILFGQTVLQDSLFSISVICTLKANTLIKHRFWTYFTQSFMWQAIHVLDGFIMLMFNERLSLIKNSIVARVSPGETSAKPAENSAKSATMRMPDVAN